MVKLLGLCFIVLSACFAWEASAQEKQALRLVQTIPLPEVKGRLDHMGVDLEKEPPVCRHRCKQFTCGCGPNWRESHQESRGIQGLAGRAIPGRRLQQTLCVQPRWACQGFPRRELLAGSGASRYERGNSAAQAWHGIRPARRGHDRHDAPSWSHDPMWEAFPVIARNHLKATLHQLHAFGHLTRFA
jgi:hypothetical protein